ncbi:MAG: sigma-70 family RNA polymerase sigma factor [Muribaculaceae bacterium]|nr:sigma-70 family RNA polymerase sigma factor [Muribaculaceae bacterium]
MTKTDNSSNNNSLTQLLNDLKKISNKEDEKDLTKRMINGDAEALNALVESNLRMVMAIAKNYQNRGFSLGDLVSEGALGLYDAARHFDGSRGVKFSTYAAIWVRKYINQALSEKGNLIRLSDNLCRDRNRLNRLKIDFVKEYDCEPSHDELAEYANMDVADVAKIDALPNCSLTLDVTISNDDDLVVCRLGDMIPCEDYTEERIDNSLLHSELLRIMSRLPQRDRDVLTLSFGLDGRGGRNAEEISQALNVKPERVRKLERIALERIRTNRTAMAALTRFAA